MVKHLNYNQMTKELKVIGIHYFGNATSGWIGYRCVTNVNDLYIMNKGDGGATYLSGNDAKHYQHLSENQLEELINQFEEVYND